MPENTRYTAAALPETVSAADAPETPRVALPITLAGWGGFASLLLREAHGWTLVWIVLLMVVTVLALVFALPIASKTGHSYARLLERVIETKGPGWFGLATAETAEPVAKSQKKAVSKPKSGKAKQTKSVPARSGSSGV